MAESSHLSVNPATERFHQYDLDDRLLKGISDLGWSVPTLIQSEAIPLVLEGKDLLARARTGSGKTGAYAIPVIQKILAIKKASPTGACGTKALVLAPSKELCQQTVQVLKDLSTHCTRDVRISDVSCIAPSTTHRTKQDAGPDIVVATPAKAVAHVTAKSLQLKSSLEVLVVDEADLTFSYGFEEDMRRLLPHLPRIHQAILMSATLSADVVTLKKLVLHNPVTLKLEEPDLPQSSQLSQYHVKCSADDKFLLLYALVKLKLVRGKTLMFVNSIDRCYQLKLFLEQFGIPACVLNSELPHNSRLHILDEFNRGVYDYVIATDEAHGLAMSTHPSKHKSAAIQKGKESGAARGIDFQGVENVVNVDFPPSPAAYVHRVGRTARGDKVGTSLSLVAPSEEELLQRTESQFTGGAVNESPVVVKPYKVKMSELEGLRYRVRDAMKAVSKSAVKEARLKEIRMEVINSDKLKVFFEDNPRDLQVLRHDKVLQPKRVQPHLKHVPSYLVPKELKRSADVGGSSKAKQPRATFSSQRKRRAKGKGAANDPLKTFAYH